MSKLMNHSISNVDKPNTFRPGKKKKKNTQKKKKLTQSIEKSFSHQEKSIEGKYCEKINIDTINSKNIFDRSTEHKQCNTP